MGRGLGNSLFGWIVVGLSTSIMGHAIANANPPIDWWGDSSEAQFSIGADSAVETPFVLVPPEQDPRRIASLYADDSSYPNAALDPNAPHLPGSGAEDAFDLDAVEPRAVTPPEAAQVDPASLISLSDVQRLVADTGLILVSPSRGWAYVNKPVYFSTDAVANDRQLTILGFPVTVHLVPVNYLWNPGDGSVSITSTGPGGSWPTGDVTHVYRKSSPSVQVELTIEWSASFTVQGTTYPIAGTTNASSASDPIEIREAEAILR